MGMAYELLSTPAAYAARPRPAGRPRRRPCATLSFGPDALQRCVLWEQEKVLHPEVVMYFHGGGYLVGAPESMQNAADVYTSQGYRFCSVGFRLMPHDRFPAQVDDAFAGVSAACDWLASRGVDAGRIVVGGSSCGGHLAYLLAYAPELQREHGLDASRIRGVVSVAGVAEADDMLLDWFWTPAVRRAFLDLPAAGGHSREEVHRALRAYSPLELARRDDVPATPLFVVHGHADRMSPYERSVELVRTLDARRPGQAELCTVDSWWWQHMVLTVCLHKRTPADFVPLASLFSWLGRLS
jgi:acetyl esterase/lipase